MVGAKRHVAWGMLALGPIWSIGGWIEFRRSPLETQREQIHPLRAIDHMIDDIEEASLASWLQR